jgi:hypothetical protein
MKSELSLFRVLRLAIFVLLAAATPAAAQSWTQLFPTGGPPPIRWQHSGAFDSTTNTLIVFGGEGKAGGAPSCSGTPCYNDVWTLSNADGQGGTPAWLQLFPTGTAPAPRFSARTVYDEANRRLILYGGGSTVSPPYFGGCTGQFNDVWVLSNANGVGGTPSWTQLSVSGGPPIARQHHAEVYDPTSNRMIVFGGNGVCGFLADLWVLTNANGLGGSPTWMQLTPAGPAPSNRHNLSYAYDQANNRMMLFGGVGCPTVVPPGGGQCSPVAFNEVWVLENANGVGGTPTWTNLAPSGTAPSARSNASVVYNSTANALLLFGGSDITGTIYFSDVWVLSNANGLGGTPTWTQVAVAGGPGPRHSFHAGYNEASDRMTIFGGLQTAPISFPLNDTWVLESAVGSTLNQPPAADAGEDQVVECASHTGTSVTLDGSASSDPDAGQTLSYEWRDAANNVVGTSAQVTLTLPLGTHVFTLTVEDGHGGTASDGVQIVVQDTTPPTLTLTSNSVTVVIPTAGATSVSVDVLAASGAAASDICDDTVALAHNGPAQFPLGTTIVTISATDDSGNVSQKQFTVQVVYRFIGFLPPIRNDGTSIFRSGRTIPVKFQLTADDGSYVSNATATLAVFRVTDAILGTTEEVTPDAAGESNTSNFFRYDSTSNQYIYDLKTTGYPAGTYILRVALNDGTTYEVQVSIR